jgi:hypothetical protein
MQKSLSPRHPAQLTPNMVLRSNKNILVLKGDVPISDVLSFLKNLSQSVSFCLQKASEETSAGFLEPWQMFALIGGCGNIGYVKYLISTSQSYQGQDVRTPPVLWSEHRQMSTTREYDRT